MVQVWYLMGWVHYLTKDTDSSCFYLEQAKEVECVSVCGEGASVCVCLCVCIHVCVCVCVWCVCVVCACVCVCVCVCVGMQAWKCIL